MDFRKKKYLLAGIIISIWLVACENKIDNRRIAHAGGGYNGDTYTNSFEALNQNIRRGFRLFEIDFSWTADDNLVCIHDWGRSFIKHFGFPMEEKPTLDEFQLLVAKKSPYHLCTLQELAEWMKINPKMILVTDVKSKNLQALELISRQIEDFEDRVIPQIYQPENYIMAKQLGFKNIIWTLYLFTESNDAVLAWSNKMKDLYAVTMPTGRAKTGLGIKLQDKGIYTYTHTVNEVSKLKFYNNLGIDNIYTDFLPPK